MLSSQRALTDETAVNGNLSMEPYVEPSMSNNPLHRWTENASSLSSLKIHCILSSHSTTKLKKEAAKLQTPNNSQGKFQNILCNVNMVEPYKSGVTIFWSLECTFITHGSIQQVLSQNTCLTNLASFNTDFVLENFNGLLYFVPCLISSSTLLFNLSS